MPEPVDIDEFFEGFESSRPLYEAIAARAIELGNVEARPTRSQIAFVRRRAFAWAWIPDRYLDGGHAPMVLSVALQRRDPSPRWKQVVEPIAGRYMHHLELRAASDVDAQVEAWLREAWSEAG